MEFAVALAAMPGDAEVLFILANTQRRQGRWLEATANFEHVFTINPYRPGVFQRRHYFAATATGEREKARTRAQAAIVKHNKVPAERWGEFGRVTALALHHVYAGLPDEARRLAARALEMRPLKSDAMDGGCTLLEIARGQVVLGDHDRALALLDQAMSGPNEKSANEISHLEPWSKPLHHGPRFEAARAKAAPRE